MFILILFKKMSKILVKILKMKKKSNIQTLYDLIRIILRGLE